MQDLLDMDITTRKDLLANRKQLKLSLFWACILPMPLVRVISQLTRTLRMYRTRIDLDKKRETELANEVDNLNGQIKTGQEAAHLAEELQSNQDAVNLRFKQDQLLREKQNCQRIQELEVALAKSVQDTEDTRKKYEAELVHVRNVAAAKDRQLQETAEKLRIEKQKPQISSSQTFCVGPKEYTRIDVLLSSKPLSLLLTASDIVRLTDRSALISVKSNVQGS